MDDVWDEEISTAPAEEYHSKSRNYDAHENGYSGRTQTFSNDRTFWNSQTSNRRGNNRGSRQGDSGFQSGRMYSDRPQGRNWRNKEEDEESSEMLIDNSFVGRVIGRGGSKIQELQTDSGAHIKVIKNEGDETETTVRLTGSAEAREKAKSLIEELTSSFANMSTSRGNRSYDQSDYSSRGNKPYGQQSDYSSRGNKSYDQSDYSSRGSRSNDQSDYSSWGNNSYDQPDYSSKSNNSYDSYGYVDYSKSKAEPPPLIDWDNLNKQSEIARQQRLAALPKIIKDFYKEDPDVAAMSPREAERFRAENNSISVMKTDSNDDRKIPNPVTSFKHAFLPYPELLEELKKQGFSSPSPIQCQAWPIILKGYDMIGIAQTGTGKTIAFLFPALIHLVGQTTPREKRVGPSVLVLAPTRELAQQIEAEAKKYTYRGIKSICIYGGGSRRNQISIATAGVDIVIATPGRLNDLVMNNVIDVTGVTYLVLDEADRMLDLGFEPQIRKIVLDIREDRQTVMTSATWTNEIQELAARYMIKPLKVNVGAFDLAAVHSVTQEIIFGEDDYDERRKILDEFIENMGPDDKCIVFVEKKAIADDISSDLILRGVNVQSIHGDREQCDREQALDDLKTGYVKILIATDVASRGIDIKDVTLILNLFFPRNIEEYVHRVGRTGRAGRTGKAISVFTRKDWMHAESFIKILEEANQFVPDELYEMADRYRAWKKKKVAEDMAAGGRNRRGRGGGRGRY